MVLVLGLFALVPEGAEGNGRCVQPRQLVEEPPERLTTHAPKLHHLGEALFCNYGSRMANKIEELLQHLQTVQVEDWNEVVLG